MTDQRTKHSGGEDTGSARDRIALRQRLERFARLRSAQRALPASARDLAEAEENAFRAARIRDKLGELAALEGSTSEVTEALTLAQPEIDAELDTMSEELRSHADETDFVQLRATIPQAVELHRKEVIALLELLLEDRAGLVDRIPRIEYLITMLSTEMEEGQRTLKHDPATLTSMLGEFDVAPADGMEPGAIAIEFYQAASFEPHDLTPQRELRRLRERKIELGAACLTPDILRAIVTYNARLYNCIEASREASRAEDLDFEALFNPTELDAASVPTAEANVTGLEEDDEIWERIGRDPQTPSVFESDEIKRIREALRRRLNGIPIGSTASERVALALSANDLGSLEREALMADEPDEEQDVIARAIIVGSMVRDLGVVCTEFDDLGVREDYLTDSWIRELSESFGRIVTSKATSPEEYDVASQLSGIKTKHLFTPMAALNAAQKRTPVVAAPGADDAAEEMNKIGREAVLDAAGGLERIKNFYYTNDAETTAGLGSINKKRVFFTSLPLMFLLSTMAVNWITAEPPNVKTLRSQELSESSPYLASAYRSSRGHGGILIGRVDPGYLDLGPRERYEVARAMSDRIGSDGVREMMIYDARGRLRIHFVQGTLRMPREPKEPQKTSKRDSQGDEWNRVPGAARGQDTWF